MNLTLDVNINLIYSWGKEVNFMDIDDIENQIANLSIKGIQLPKDSPLHPFIGDILGCYHALLEEVEKNDPHNS
jgi:hypothetical protein